MMKMMNLNLMMLKKLINQYIKFFGENIIKFLFGFIIIIKQFEICKKII